jgi:hypothetical protein
MRAQIVASITGLGAGDVWELPELSAQFCYEFKTALKNSLFFFNLEEKGYLDEQCCS